jgi:hypothetical protein
VYRDGDGDAEEIATPTRRFSLLDITSGLPDDSQEAEEREADQRLRDLRGRVKAARAVIAGTPILAETLKSDWQRAIRFYARFGVTEELVKHGAPPAELRVEDLFERLDSSREWSSEVRAHSEVVLPER